MTGRIGARTGGAVAAAIAATAAAWADPVPRERVEAAVAEIGTMAETLVAGGAAPGMAIVVVHEDETVYLRGFGLRRVGAPETVDGDTVFQIASMSKPVSATVVARLVGQGVLDWDAKVADLDPAFRLYEPYPTAEVTVRDLFNHRSGLPGGAGNDLEDVGFGREHVLRQLRLVAPASSFRAGYAYSNAGLTAGAVAAARPTGKDWETVADETLFGPAGMTSTSYRYDAFVGRDNAAALHVPGAGGGWEARIKRDPTTQAPAGAVSSNARDLARWMRLELGEGVLDGAPLIDPEALAATHAPLFSRGPNPVTGDPSFYGLGWNVEIGRHGMSWGHAGAFSVGGRSMVTLWPGAELGIVVLANAFPTGAPEGIVDTFADLVFDGAPAQDYVAAWDAIYAGLFGPSVEAAVARYASPPEPATPALPAAAYVGTYANAYVGDAVVSDEAGGLVLAVGPQGRTRWPLTHFDRDLFLYFPDPETPTRPSAAQFRVGPDGVAAAVEIETFEDNGWGTLSRVAR
jgi:CubicO group peptidase (beta-lactamase class C family)